jgi:O-antigen/teichoic acid export membrane protein
MLRRVATRFGWGVADQALSSLTNFALGVAVARSVSAEDFGAYAIVFSTYLVALNVTRQLAVQPIAIRYASADAPTWRRVTGASTGLVVVLACVMAVVFVGAGVAIGGHVGGGMVALGITLPGLLLQDAWRLAFFAAGRGAAAFANDAVWALVLFPGFLVLGAAGFGASLVAILALWGFSGCVAAAVGIVQSRVIPLPGRARSWWREHRDLGPRYLASELIPLGATQGVIYILGLVAGLAAAGSLRAAQLLLGPLNILTMSIYFVAVPFGARIYAEEPSRLRGVAAAIAGLMVAATLTLTIAILVFPEMLGPLLLGESWPGAELVFIPVAIATVGKNLGYGPRTALLAMAMARRTLRLTVIESVLAVVAGTVGAILGAATGAAWALALVSGTMAVLWWRELGAGLRAPVPVREAASPIPPSSATDTVA